MNLTIVLGKLVTELEVTSTDGYDLGKRPKTREVKRPQTIMWLREGTYEDVLKAQAHAKSEDYKVFLYITSESDPLGQAKKELMK
jgi:hypothetical protein